MSEESHIDVTEEMNREVESVCNLSTGIYDKGKREGLHEGKNEGALEMLFSLVKNNLLSIAVAAKQADMDPAVFERKYGNYISE